MQPCFWCRESRGRVSCRRRGAGGLRAAVVALKRGPIRGLLGRRQREANGASVQAREARRGRPGGAADRRGRARRGPRGAGFGQVRNRRSPAPTSSRTYNRPRRVRTRGGSSRVLADSQPCRLVRTPGFFDRTLLTRRDVEGLSPASRRRSLLASSCGRPERPRRGDAPNARRGSGADAPSASVELPNQGRAAIERRATPVYRPSEAAAAALGSAVEVRGLRRDLLSAPAVADADRSLPAPGKAACLEDLLSPCLPVVLIIRNSIQNGLHAVRLAPGMRHRANYKISEVLIPHASRELPSKCAQNVSPFELYFPFVVQ